MVKYHLAKYWFPPKNFNLYPIVLFFQHRCNAEYDALKRSWKRLDRKICAYKLDVSHNQFRDAEHGMYQGLTHACALPNTNHLVAVVRSLQQDANRSPLLGGLFANDFEDRTSSRVMLDPKSIDAIATSLIKPPKEGANEIVASLLFRSVAMLHQFSLAKFREPENLQALGIDPSRTDLIFPGSADGGAGDTAGAPAESAAEKTAFDVRLEAFEASSKLKIVKEVRAITGLGLKESKALVEAAPSDLKSGVTKEEAEEIKEKLSAIGATIVLA